MNAVSENLSLARVTVVLMVLSPTRPAPILPVLGDLLAEARAMGISVAHGRRRSLPLPGLRAECLRPQVSEMIVTIDDGLFECLPFRHTLASLHRPWLIVAGHCEHALVEAARDSAAKLGIVLSSVQCEPRSAEACARRDSVDLMSVQEAHALLRAAGRQFVPFGAPPGVSWG